MEQHAFFHLAGLKSRGTASGHLSRGMVSPSRLSFCFLDFNYFCAGHFCFSSSRIFDNSKERKKIDDYFYLLEDRWAHQILKSPLQAPVNVEGWEDFLGLTRLVRLTDTLA